jgi:hypothetical protein
MMICVRRVVRSGVVPRQFDLAGDDAIALAGSVRRQSDAAGHRAQGRRRKRDGLERRDSREQREHKHHSHDDARDVKQNDLCAVPRELHC